METQLERLRERAGQLKEKRPGYGDILDFYVKVREAQFASKVSLKVHPVKPIKKRGPHPSDEGLSLIGEKEFPVDIEAAISLFHALCRIAERANAHLAEEVEKIGKTLKDKTDVENLLLGREKEQTAGHGAADPALDRKVLSFLIRNSIGPSIEMGMEQLMNAIEPETWRKKHCPLCGSRPALNLLKGEGGKRYSLCSYCGCQWRIDRLSCAVCGNSEQGSLSYFYAEGDEVCRIDLCDTCRHYVKTIDCRELEEPDPSLEDLGTLHLDVVALQKGYKRSVPNPWGM